jgi:Holliday junction resolvase RusA-like endonuclease
MKLHIVGIPYGKLKVRGDLTAPRRWTQAVVDQTSAASPISGPCHLRVIFFLPPNKYPADLPFGPDLDNLLKRLFDGLNRTIFRQVPGLDSCILTLSASKVAISQVADAGVEIEVTTAPIGV